MESAASSAGPAVSSQPEPDPPPPPYSPAPPPEGARAAAAPPLGHRPHHVVCPNCRNPVVTTVVYVNSNKTHILAGFICGFMLWCMLCCVAALPYYMRCAKVAEHYCPHCKFYIGGYSIL